MKRFFKAALAWLLLLAVHSIQAAGVPAAPDTRELSFLDANAPAMRIDVEARGGARWLAFVAAAGESVAIDLDASTLAGACAAELFVVDAEGRLVQREACVGAAGRTATFIAPAAGTYRVGWRAHAGAEGTLQVALRSAARERAPQPLACTNHPMDLDTPTNGTWSNKCTSISFSGHYAQYYKFTVPSTQVITITLSSATVNAYLVLHDGGVIGGTTIATDDNSGQGNDAMIVKTLPAGTYTIEATTSLAGATGDFSIVARTNTAPCFGKLTLNKVATSKWVTDCESLRLGDHYAKFYSMTVPSEQVITITLSSTTNSYLVLRSGPTQLGVIVAENDNSGPNLDARIVQRLAAGTYVIEATTSTASQLGDFTLVARTDKAPCNMTASLDQVASDSWSTDCSSVSFDDHYAKYYTVTLATPQIVTATLSSTTNAYLVLHSGPDQLGPVIAQDDNSGASLDARLVLWLAAGTYTYEATTQPALLLGDFTFAPRTNSAPCFKSIGLNGSDDSSWITDCTSTSFSDHFSKYYTITVPTAQVVTILLTSSTNDYLVLRGGPDAQLGPIVKQDDNSGGGTNAMIQMSLSPGAYTIEATTQAASQFGDFTITVSH
jgi:hypothetical protein